MTLGAIARAGLPIGVGLTRIIRDFIGRQATHYGISVIRDRGVDLNALAYIVGRHSPESVVFVDGWTGKGVIARELAKSVQAASLESENLVARLDPALAVLSDLAGLSGLASGTDDYLIPTSLLNSVVSGLVSRTVLAEGLIGPDDFHGCLYHGHLAPWDLSREVADRVAGEALSVLKAAPGSLKPRFASSDQRSRGRKASGDFMEAAKKEFGVSDENLIKPGLGEATRVLLRRAPRVVMVRDPSDPDVEHVSILAKDRGVDVLTVPDLFYRAAAVIRVVAG